MLATPARLHDERRNQRPVFRFERRKCVKAVRFPFVAVDIDDDKLGRSETDADVRVRHGTPPPFDNFGVARRIVLAVRHKPAKRRFALRL
ncbi:hypothetical protein HDG34_007742 [Paraburkholderia sp. HC6.4b]|nr:hypothetical protein [Paraburkholderia sp. HC6.4b]